jgi:replicative DNA helicase
MAVSIKKDFGTGRNRKPELSPSIYGKVPPQAAELEEAVLGACMLEKDTFAQITEIIQTPECFYFESNKKIYGAMRRLFDKGMPVDLLTITEELRKTSELEIVGGAYYLTKLTMSVLSSAHAEAHARIIMEKFIQRELIRISSTIIADAYEDSADVFDLLDKAEVGLYEITDKHLRKNFKSLQEIMKDTMEEISEARKKTDDITGIPSGFKALDRITAGWQRTDLIILAARPSVGKTAFALNLAMNAAMNPGKAFPVAVFSLEMGAGQIVKRMLSAVTEVSMEAITKGKMAEHEFLQMTTRMSKLTDAKIFLDDQAALNIFELRAKARRLKNQHDIQLIIIDYLQLMQGSVEKGGNREQEISKISRDLKALAKELEVPIIALSQLNRSVETRGQSKMPQLSDLRESGAIEQDADMVMFLYRQEYYGLPNDQNGETVEGETVIKIAKHRNGSTGEEKVRFIKEYQRFVDMDEKFDSFSPQGNNAFPGTGNDKYAKPAAPSHENPHAGITFKRDSSEFGGSKVFIPEGYQTRSSKANDINWEEDEFGAGLPQKKKPTQNDEDVPF